MQGGIVTVRMIPTRNVIPTAKAIRQKMTQIGAVVVMGKRKRVVVSGEEAKRENTREGEATAARQSGTGIEHFIDGGREYSHTSYYLVLIQVASLSSELL